MLGLDSLRALPDWRDDERIQRINAAIVAGADSGGDVTEGILAALRDAETELLAAEHAQAAAEFAVAAGEASGEVFTAAVARVAEAQGAVTAARSRLGRVDTGAVPITPQHPAAAMLSDAMAAAMTAAAVPACERAASQARRLIKAVDAVIEAADAYRATTARVDEVFGGHDVLGRGVSGIRAFAPEFPVALDVAGRPAAVEPLRQWRERMRELGY